MGLNLGKQPKAIIHTWSLEVSSKKLRNCSMWRKLPEQERREKIPSNMKGNSCDCTGHTSWLQPMALWRFCCFTLRTLSSTLDFKWSFMQFRKHFPPGKQTQNQSLRLLQLEPKSKGPFYMQGWGSKSFPQISRRNPNPEHKLCPSQFFLMFWVLVFQTTLHSPAKHRRKLQTKHPTTKLNLKMPGTNNSTRKGVKSPNPKW